MRLEAPEKCYGIESEPLEVLIGMVQVLIVKKKGKL